MPLDFQNTPKHHQDVLFLKYQDVQPVCSSHLTYLHRKLLFAKAPNIHRQFKKLLMKNNIAKVQEIYWYILVCERVPERPSYRFLQIQSSSNVHHFIIS